MRTKKSPVLLHQLLAGTMLAALAAGSSSTAANAAADLIAVNGDVRTVDPNTPRVEAFAVEGGKFVAVGTSAEIRSLADDKTTVLDLGGKTVTPGFIDGHTHLTSGTDYVTGVDLSYIPDKETWLKKIKEADERLPPGVWITGGGWDYTLKEGKLPTKEDIDAVVKDRPVVLRDIDFHSIWVNTKALEIGGVTAKSEVPAGGEVVVDAKTGEPTGILLEGAGDLITNKKPAYSDKERAEALLQTVKFANSVGLTGVHDMSSIAAVYDYLKLVEDKNLSLRVWYGFFEDKAANIPAAAKDREAVDSRVAASGETKVKGPLLTVGYAKSVVDGVLSTHTAYLLENYSDRTGWKGEPFQSEADLSALIKAANDNGFPTAVHAIGDAGVQMTLNAFEKGQSPGKYPNRVEHIEIISPPDIERFKKLGIVASMQPNHATGTIGKYITERVGHERENHAYVWKSMLQHKVPVVFGSDWATSPLSPLTQINDAVFRESPFGLGDGPWHPEQAVTFDEALFAYTQAGANMTPWANEIGSISTGKWADFVVLDAKLPDPVDRSIRKRHVEATYVAGTEVYRAK
ncbi:MULTISPECIES: amidohydrolase [unclassified Ensifer]|uniref:amidohydrolase n=1 Tax=unclassified Ensifer TaxID=2633371 RepID=UPI00042E4E50|nr:MULTISPECIES: amidohydrolase [unclassified Ensifer]AHK46701.1 putative periplasmic protein [Ensifer adhaerens OV14]MDP9629477.1 putative amidohydrolase YtcJ [Ensifer adhaerens]